MAIGRAYPIKKNAVKAYGYTKPPKKRASGPRFAANGSVTHIAAINGRGAYRATARSRMSGLSSNSRRTAARSSLSAAKKSAFARKMRAEKRGTSSLRSNGSRLRVKRKTFKANRTLRKRPGSSPRSSGHYERRATETVWVPARKTKKSSRRAKPARRKATRKTPMARKTRRRKKAAARSTPVRRAKRRVKRRKSAKRSAVAPKRRKRRKARKAVAKTAPKRKRRRKAKKTTLKANRRRSRRAAPKRRRLKRNSGTRAGALKGWRKRRAKRKSASPKRRRRSRKASAVAPKRRRRSRRASAAPKRRRRRSRKATLKANPRRRRRSTRRRLTSNRKRRTSRRTRRMSSNRKRRSSRRLRRNGRRRMFRKNGILEPIVFIAKTGGIALAGLLAHKILTNALVTYGLNKFLGAPAAVVATSPTTTAVTPATSGLGGLSLDPQYQRVLGSFLIAAGGVFAAAKVIKDPTVRNTVMTGIGLSFMTTLASAVLTKFAPQYSGILAGPSDGTAARLSAMYGFGGTSIQPRYQAIGRGMGEYFTSGVSGLGEYFDSGVSGLGEYFQSGVNGLGALPSYEANAGYGSNPDLMEAAAGMGARETTNTNHIDPHGDLDRQLTIAEAAAGVGAYEAAAGLGAISTVPSSSTWIPGMSDGQIWAGTRSISAPQSASELTPAGILQTDGGQGVFG